MVGDVYSSFFKVKRVNATLWKYSHIQTFAEVKVQNHQKNVLKVVFIIYIIIIIADNSYIIYIM